MAGWGLNSEHTDLKRVLVNRPRDCVQTLRAADLEACNFEQPMKANIARLEHDHFTKTLASHGAEVIDLGELLRGDVESQGLLDRDPNCLFTRDIAVMTPSGALLMNMGLEQRRPEVELVRRACDRLEVPILGALRDPAVLEGGGLIWLTERVVAVGLCDRSSGHTLSALAQIVLGDTVDEIWGVHLPPGSVHIDGMMTMPGPGVAWIRPEVLGPASCDVVTTGGSRTGLFVEELGRIDVEVEAFEGISGMAVNVIWTSPFTGIAAEAPGIEEVTLAADRHGGRLDVFDGAELVKGNGGAHCMTCPVHRL